MKKTKTILLFTFLLILVASITHAALLSKYVSITGYVTILPSEEPNTPPNKFACMNGGYINYVTLLGEPFSNQGDCVSYVATNMCSNDGWTILTREDGTSFNSQGQCVAYFAKNKKPDKDASVMQTNNLNETFENTTTNTTINYNLTNTSFDNMTNTSFDNFTNTTTNITNNDEENNWTNTTETFDNNLGDSSE